MRLTLFKVASLCNLYLELSMKNLRPQVWSDLIAKYWVHLWHERPVQTPKEALSDEQIAFARRQADAGTSVGEILPMEERLCRAGSFRDPDFLGRLARGIKHRNSAAAPCGRQGRHQTGGPAPMMTAVQSSPPCRGEEKLSGEEDVMSQVPDRGSRHQPGLAAFQCCGSSPRLKWPERTPR